MARTWTFVEQIAAEPWSWDRAVPIPDCGGVYFIDADRDKVYSWAGATSLTDIAGTFFTNISGFSELHDLCVFDGDLYAFGNVYETWAAKSGDYDHGYIWKYDGSGQSWTEVETLLVTNVHDTYWGKFDDSAAQNWIADADDTRMACTGSFLELSNGAWGKGGAIDTTDGTTWNYDTTVDGDDQFDGTYTSPGYMFGLNRGTGYSELLADGIYHYDTGNWDPLGSYVTAYGQAGYAGGYSFWYAPDSSNRKLQYSLNWGSATDAGVGSIAIANRHHVRQIQSDVIMYHIIGSNQAYTWNSGTLQMDADGTTPANRPIRSFFCHNSQLFALCHHETSGGTIYSGGMIGIPSLGGVMTHSGAGLPGDIMIVDIDQEATITSVTASYSPGGFGLPSQLDVEVVTSAPTRLYITVSGGQEANVTQDTTTDTHTFYSVPASGTVNVYNYFDNTETDSDTW